MNFQDLGLKDQLKEGLSAMGFDKPTPIQEKAIPLILEHHDVIGCAQTGTGKTGAYLIPILNNIISLQNDNEGVNTVVIVPTRELALQIDQQVEGFGYFLPVSSLAIYGGGDGLSWEQEKKALQKGVDIVIATPGRFISHLNLGYVDLSKVKHLVLDEADRMLDMGFHDDIMKIIGYMPKKKQGLLFSATMPHKISILAKKILSQPKEVSIAISKTAKGVIQAAFIVYEKQKESLVIKLIKSKAEELKSIIVFVSAKKKIQSLDSALKRASINVKSIHSGLDQKEREQVLLNFRSRKVQVLVATDILSRGIDIDDIGLVINYDVPPNPEDYVHRVGRTARAERKGYAVTLVNEEDQWDFHKIEKLIGKDVKKAKLPESIGEGPAYTPNKRQKTFKKKRW